MATRVFVDLRFKEYGRKVERGVDRALERTAASVERTAKVIAAPRGGLESRIRRTRPRRSRRGREISVDTDGVGYLQEVGTKRKLGAAKSKRARGGGRGVKPLRFLRKSLRAHRGELVDNLRSEFPS